MGLGFSIRPIHLLLNIYYHLKSHINKGNVYYRFYGSVIFLLINIFFSFFEF